MLRGAENLIKYQPELEPRWAWQPYGASNRTQISLPELHVPSLCSHFKYLSL